TNTTMRTPFGPTLCRSMHYCHNCHQLFEQFKPI
ncbi:MAG: phenylacetate-CoA oxygenase subunit PaaJ, partial [Bacteroidota bacterium]|nr:phenylacetate-CoA oxygenase subunit PaaJ [Bacteroidota bacterium]